MELELNTIIGDPAKLGRDCEIHQHKHVKYTFIICYIRMIVFVEIVPIVSIYNAILFLAGFLMAYVRLATGTIKLIAAISGRT